MDKVLILTENWQILKKAMPGKKEDREAMKRIHVTEKWIYVTNGRIAVRMIRDHASIKDPGTYEIISAGKGESAGFTALILERDEINTFPDVGRVFPEKDGGEHVMIELFPAKDDSGLSISKAMIDLYKHTGNAFNYTILEILASNRYGWSAHKQGERGAGGAAYLKSTDHTAEAVILPFRAPFRADQ